MMYDSNCKSCKHLLELRSYGSDEPFIVNCQLHGMLQPDAIVLTDKNGQCYDYKKEKKEK